MLTLSLDVKFLVTVHTAATDRIVCVWVFTRHSCAARHCWGAY